MKILFITTAFEDYLQDQLLIGLRNILGVSVVDFPKKSVMYSNCEKPSSELYGCGFTIWRLLEDEDIDRSHIEERLLGGEFDLVVFGSIWRQRDTFERLRKLGLLRKVNACFLDGEDHSRIFYKALPYGSYFKRERIGLLARLLSNSIGFSIPERKIRGSMLAKRKTFAMHVQCDEAYKLDEIAQSCQRSYAFSDEALYYEDIGSSYFAVTMKKAGWDCMRHLEISANGAVPCFYRLSDKPALCAPHGLIDMHNVVAFDTAEELKEKIEAIGTGKKYEVMQQNTLKWALCNSCENVARDLMRACS